MQSPQDVQLAGFPAISSIYPSPHLSSSSSSPPSPPNASLTRIRTQFSDIAPTAMMLPYILQQQQLLLSQHLYSSSDPSSSKDSYISSLTKSQQEYLSQPTQPQIFPHQGQQNSPTLTPQEQRDILISIHHMCQDIKDSLKTLHSRVDEMWAEVGSLRERQHIVEEHCTTNDSECDGDYEEVEEDETCRMEAEVPCDD